MAGVIDLSCDLGEASTPEERAVEEALWPLITSANVACGGHAGDEATMHEAAQKARHFSVLLGAHPSYPDREHFGRQSIAIDLDVLRHSLLRQIELLQGIAASEHVELTHVKPHGALYNDAHRDVALARTIVEAVAEVSRTIAVVSSPRSALYDEAFREGLPVAAEAFGDRRYRLDGSLVPRSELNALLLDPSDAAAQALSLAERKAVHAAGGTEIEIPFATLCVHADMPQSVARLTAIRARLANAGFQFSSDARFS